MTTPAMPLPSAYKTGTLHSNKLDKVTTYTKQDDTQNTATDSSKTPTTSLAFRAIKCAGKILFGVFVVPVIAVLKTLVLITSCLKFSYVRIIAPAFKKNAIYGALASVTIAPILFLITVPVFSVTGFVVGVRSSVEAVNNWSTEPLKGMFYLYKKKEPPAILV